MPFTSITLHCFQILNKIVNISIHYIQLASSSGYGRDLFPHDLASPVTPIDGALKPLLSNEVAALGETTEKSSRQSLPMQVEESSLQRSEGTVVTISNQLAHITTALHSSLPLDEPEAMRPSLAIDEPEALVFHTEQTEASCQEPEAQLSSSSNSVASPRSTPQADVSQTEESCQEPEAQLSSSSNSVASPRSTPQADVSPSSIASRRNTSTFTGREAHFRDVTLRHFNNMMQQLSLLPDSLSATSSVEDSQAEFILQEQHQPISSDVMATLNESDSDWNEFCRNVQERRKRKRDASTSRKSASPVPVPNSGRYRRIVDRPDRRKKRQRSASRQARSRCEDKDEDAANFLTRFQVTGEQLTTLLASLHSVDSPQSPNRRRNRQNRKEPRRRHRKRVALKLRDFILEPKKRWQLLAGVGKR